MDELYQEQARRIWETAARLQQPEKYAVGIAGVPGSGKSTAATRVAEQINLLSSSEPRQAAVVVQMDGFHFYRKQLDAMPDPAEAHARRGAHWTFDAHRFLQAVIAVRKAGEASLPSFDHAEGDPVEDDVIVLPSHTVVLLEGLYLLYDEEPWSQVKAHLDEAWFVDADVDAALDRVIARQVQNGASEVEASLRVANNDRPNAYLVDATKDRADLILPRLPLEHA